jgi:glycolate oxidase FAD binding subunit
MYAALGPSSGVAALDDLRAAIAPFDGSAVVIDAPADIREGLDHWGPVGDALDLMRRVKLQFDPDRRLSPGRFVGGM